MKNLATDLVEKARDRVRPVEVKGLKLADRALARLHGDVRRRLGEIELETHAATRPANRPTASAS